MSAAGEKRRFGDVRVTFALLLNADIHHEGAARLKSARTRHRDNLARNEEAG
jgi:hypothetical protein